MIGMFVMLKNGSSSSAIVFTLIWKSSTQSCHPLPAHDNKRPYPPRLDTNENADTEWTPWPAWNALIPMTLLPMVTVPKSVLVNEAIFLRDHPKCCIPRRRTKRDARQLVRRDKTVVSHERGHRCRNVPGHLARC